MTCANFDARAGSDEYLPITSSWLSGPTEDAVCSVAAVSASRFAWYGALATAIAWALKALAIWEAGGLGKTSLEDLGWAVGTLLFLITWAALGAAFTAGRAIWLRIVASVLGVVLGFVLFATLDSAADVLPESAGWVREEAGLWAAALVTLAVAWWQRPRAASQLT